MSAKTAATKQERIARDVHRLTTSGVAFETHGKVHEYELFACAAAGVAILNGISLDAAKALLIAKSGA